mmetsp:Transcript_26481/g.61764  ORF Transcript_26481/g.61764 Transcript_26481/m.61764 type:complete len:633 (+) Transcript_26481:51-1949(+)|eukprot:CAMPEP_0178423148 /NCGR_PEP_ID=MMETSP0689_2-20121128/27540_1 /TAXON_ID=160604 /ORGANISM="Amphidinium massartii, Strain CS-259" /LENGTH=632 /DNA_ID=CAMNT_0020044735 /DNA_START=37 /DNA_END=1935 /DNA_ORIENTATION=+
MAASASSKARRRSSWVDLHAPKHLGEVMGHTDQVRKLAEWLRDFDDVVLHGKLKEIVQPQQEEWRRFKPQPENINARAALISGPPGIGKTTTCKLLARCFAKYDLMEFNASDARSKAVVEHISNSLAGSRMLKLSANSEGCLKRTVLIMDECDGMTAGDRGGMQALINMIKVTKNPIICICNDRQDLHVRNLAQHCLDIRFKRPEAAVVAKRVKAILQSSSATFSSMALEGIIEACGNDIRQVLNQVQFFGLAGACRAGNQKDQQVMLTAFDACQKLLVKDSTVKFETKLDLLYVDTEMLPLLVQENYLRPLEKLAPDFGGYSSGYDLSTCAYAAELLALGDTLSGSMDWSLESAWLTMGALYPTALTAGEAVTRPQFPVWLQKRSAHNRSRRLAQELSIRVKSTTTGTSRSFVTGFNDTLYRRLCGMLASGDVKRCASTLVRHGLTREFLAEQASVFRQPLGLPDLYKQFDLKVKTQLLQEVQSLVQLNAPVKRKRVEEPASQAPGHAMFGDSLGVDDHAEDSQPKGQEEDDDDAMVTKKKKVAAKKPVKELTRNKQRDAADLEKCSLSKWCIGKPAQQNAADPAAKDAPNGGEAVPKSNGRLTLRYIEGHTCAVRRKVLLQDLVGPWKRM